MCILPYQFNSLIPLIIHSPELSHNMKYCRYVRPACNFVTWTIAQLKSLGTFDENDIALSDSSDSKYNLNPSGDCTSLLLKLLTVRRQAPRFKLPDTLLEELSASSQRAWTTVHDCFKLRDHTKKTLNFIQHDSKLALESP